ncbi:ribosomal RNA-processing protein 8 [Trichoplusia ni]|uniref:Ribosomal RNA-processing protein 8 n=1 Tax=Trichoplusia ni TaxID=7111 RepID=A0A7E5WWL4_TRINI|nr:ribosomal RNA-processing protein 8 [Trichoplusia ni]
MFEVPAWGDDVPKSDAKFMRKAKKKDKKPTEQETKAPKVEKINRIPTNNLTNGPRKRKLENKRPDPKKKDKITNNKKQKLHNTNKKVQSKGRPQCDPIPDTQNFDEVLLNAKKKKFNESIKNDDQEDLLFSEKKQKKIKKKIVNQNSISLNSIQVENNNIVKKKVSNKLNGVVKTEPINAKKAKLKALLENKSMRSHIDITKTSNSLRQRMLERFKAAQFRFLNEKLYTTSGSEAQKLFSNDPAAFKTYHQGYQLQVKKWPVKPLDVIVKRIMKMPKTSLIADMGCGEAALSRRVPQRVRSFDLLAAAPGVEACDMARTPLLAAAVDVAVYCLALMGTDLTQYLIEANRVLKMGGHLLIAEVESRFDKVETFTSDVERLGFKLKQLDKNNDVFFFMEFIKVRDPPVKKAKLPAITLKPCLYKRR